MDRRDAHLGRRDALRLLALVPAAGRFAWAEALAPIPSTQNAPDVEIALSAGQDDVPILAGDPTRVWRYRASVVRGPASALESVPGSYLGPTIRLERGQRVRVRFRNELSEPSIVHWHGLDVPEAADGHPRLAIGAGEEYVYDFTVTNRAGTYWYHPHPHGRTGPQVYRGMAGLLIVDDDDEAALDLPAGRSELHCVIQDRLFDAANQLVYPAEGAGPAGGRGMGRGIGMGRGMMGRGGGQQMGMAAMMATETGVLGDRVLVNGRSGYTAEVEAGWIRVRVLNGSNARVYKLAWSDGRPMRVIGGDGGLLAAATDRTALTLGPAQRVDVLVDLSDLSSGDELRLVSQRYPANDAGHMDMMMASAPGLPSGAELDIMTVRVSGRNTRRMTLPDRLSSFDETWTVVDDAPVRRIPLSFARMQWLLGGRVFDMTDVAPEETVRAGSTHVWELQNTTNPMGMEMAHPIHLHGRQFRVLGRSGGSPANALREGLVDDGWTDTVLVLPGETVRIQVTFSEHVGLFLYHCHLLEHEDAGMMRNVRLTDRTR